jgi:hypothetical protein
MANQWCVLTTRMGADVREPTYADLRAALEDVFTSVDDEHPNTSLRLGADTGPMFVLSVYSSKRVVFEQWADADFDVELAPPIILTDVRQEVSVMLWQALRNGDIDAVRRHASA